MEWGERSAHLGGRIRFDVFAFDGMMDYNGVGILLFRSCGAETVVILRWSRKLWYSCSRLVITLVEGGR